MNKSNFDLYLEGQLKDPLFAARFKRAGDAWDVALQLAALRERAGLSQKDLARILKTSQQQVSRLESPAYEGHSLSMLRRVASALNTRVRVVFEPMDEMTGNLMVEERPRVKKPRKRCASDTGASGIRSPKARSRSGSATGYDSGIPG